MELPIIAWNQCLSIIRNQVSEDMFDVWFSPIIPIEKENNIFTLQVPNQFFYEYLEENYAELILQSLSKVTGQSLQLKYQIEVKSQVKNNVKLPVKEEKWHSNTDKRKTFDTFFKSDCNKIAYGIAEKIVREPGKDFNPYFIYGGTGVGKTHLCHAMGNEIEKIHLQKKVLYISAPSFQIQFTDSILNKKQNDFIRFYQQVDVLILDDIQEFSGKEKTIQAYFHLFNHLHHLGKQLILTADKMPAEIEGLEERLISRFKWGLVMKMCSPDKELRKKIIQYKLQQNKLEFSEEIIEYIVNSVTENTRELEGIVNSLSIRSLLGECEMDLHLVQKLIHEIVRNKNKQMTLKKVQQTVSSYFKIAIDQILSKSRRQEVVQARHIAMFLSKKHTDSSYKCIGMHTGHRDHATVLYACKSIRDRLNTDRNFCLTVNEIETLLWN